MNTIQCFGKTDTGLVRLENEDTYVIDVERRFCLVADGMGGQAGGKLASHIFAEAADAIFSYDLRISEANLNELMQKTFWHANQSILKHVESNPHLKGMGCTAELIVFSDSNFLLGHIGDSRTYQLRHGQLKQLTKDHSLVQDQLDQGLISDPQAAVHSMRNVILRAVGVEANFQLDIIRGTIRQGDYYLLCSDGLTDFVDDDEIKDILLLGTALSIKVDKLISKAISSGGKDNISVVLTMVGT
jgi:protein phosphatase